MDDKKKLIALSLVLFSLLSIIFTFLFNQNAPPVSDFEIPQSTKDFFKRIGDLGHIKFDYVDSLDSGDFDNNSDYSEDFKKLEDENFIVYFHDKGNELMRAQKTLQYANNAIPELSRFFGKYYYARDTKNRKLPIYLALSQEDFDNTSIKVGGSSVGWAAGLTFNSFSSNGDKVCDGIVLNSMVQDGEGTDLKKVVFHEMAHFNHFQCFDLANKIEYMNWEMEGVASYFAKDWNKVIPRGTQLSQYSLMRDPTNYVDSYWMGYHAFDLANEMGRLSEILKNSYTKSLMIAIPNNAGCNMTEYDNKWRKHCRMQ